METANRSEFDLLPAPQAERSEQLAVDVLRVVSASLGAGPSLESFRRSLTANVADLVGASRVLLWELGPDRTLRAVPGAHGVEDDLVARLDPVPCDPDGGDLMNQVGLRDLQASNAISAPWRAGDTRLGVVAAYDSINAEGFTSEEAWILEISGIAAGLVWQARQAAAERSEAVERLREVDSARHMLLRNLSTAVDRASKRFATELHDDALQKLTAAEIRLAGLAASMSGDKSRTGIDEISALLQQVEEALRNLLQNIRPPSLETPGGLEMTIRQRLAALTAQSGIAAECLVDLPDEPPYEIKSVLHRQISEALTNIEKHAQATRVYLELRAESEGIYGAVTDNGKGFVVSERDRLPGHLGLMALGERPLLAGGWGKIASEPGVGTTVEFWVPLPK